MRTGLVMVGSALVVLGLLILTLGALNLPHTVSSGYVEHTLQIQILPGKAFNYTLVGPPNAAPPLVIDFSSSSPVRVWLTGCPPPPSGVPSQCIVTAVVRPATHGTLEVNGTLFFPYYLAIYNNNTSAPAEFQADVQLPETALAGLPMWEGATIVAGGSVLLVGGIISFYVGLFLKRGAMTGRGAEIPEMPVDPNWTPPTAEEVEATRKAMIEAAERARRRFGSPGTPTPGSAAEEEAPPEDSPRGD